jgi:hypothetical protein
MPRENAKTSGDGTAARAASRARREERRAKQREQNVVVRVKTVDDVYLRFHGTQH